MGSFFLSEESAGTFKTFNNFHLKKTRNLITYSLRDSFLCFKVDAPKWGVSKIFLAEISLWFLSMGSLIKTSIATWNNFLI